MPTDPALAAPGETRFERHRGGVLGPGHGLPPRAAVASRDVAFIALLNGFRSRGGLQRLSALQAARRGAWRADVIETLPERVAGRTALGIVWDQEAWVPTFQFNRQGTIQRPAAAVFLELSSSHDPWELATWFITPCNWLQHLRPVDLLEWAPARVLEAARADRYVARGG